MKQPSYIGIDLGGTTVSAGLVDGNGITRLETVDVNGDRPPDEIFETIAALVGSVASGSDFGGIGVGVPVPSGPKSERLDMCMNIPQFEGFPIRARLSERFGVPVLLENDANCMTFGEQRFGALSGCLNCVCLTLGTGLGCGVIIDGKLHRGELYRAGEIWNIPLPGGEILEDLTAIRGLRKCYADLTGSDLEPKQIYDRYKVGEIAAVEAFNKYGEAVGMTVVMILSTIDPEKIAIGGGIAGAFDAFQGSMARVIEKAWSKDDIVKIVPAELSDKAAILGAAALIGEYLLEDGEELFK